MSVAFRVDQVEYPFPAKPQPLSEARKAELKAEIKALLKARNAVLVAHYYTDHEIQALAEETGGCVADSLEMARFGRDAQEQTLIVAGVRFMGETAKILSPEKTVLMPTLEATCSLDIGCPVKEFSEFCDLHPDHTVVVYANTSAAVKARADWVVTSSIALEIVEHLDSQGKKIICLYDTLLDRTCHISGLKRIVFTFVHEIGHWLHLDFLSEDARDYWNKSWEGVIPKGMDYLTYEQASKNETLKSLGIPTPYGHRDPYEDFAETFAHFILKPEMLSERALERMKETLRMSYRAGRSFMRLAHHSPDLFMDD